MGEWWLVSEQCYSGERSKLKGVGSPSAVSTEERGSETTEPDPSAREDSDSRYWESKRIWLDLYGVARDWFSLRGPQDTDPKVT